MENLPENVTATDHRGDIVLSGPNMTTATFAEIKNAMHPEDRNRVIGWIKTGR